MECNLLRVIKHKNLFKIHRNTKSSPPPANIGQELQVATMKSLSTLSFTVLTPLVLSLFNLMNYSSYSGSVQAALLPNIPPPNLPPALLQEYYKLFDMCNNGGANAVRCLHLRA